MEIKRTATANITEDAFYNAAQSLYDDYGLEFGKTQVLEYVIYSALNCPDGIEGTASWIECLTPNQTDYIMEHMRDVFADYMHETANALWDAMMEEE